ncbi:hypothetical protein [Brevibacillus reuszeri]|uniref:hypothetical protein n=1 Tax=Brevibacillus reuszeri TaxID=54915 RepID=UPI0013DEC5E8|nr:hypothetical protein [Brevibacillus reuszeri]
MELPISIRKSGVILVKRLSLVAFVLIFLVGCSNNQASQVATVEPQEKVAVQENSAAPEASIAEQKYHAMIGTGLSLEPFENKLTGLKWETHNQGSFLENISVSDEDNMVSFNFFGPKDDLKRLSISGIEHANSAEKSEATILYLVSFLREVIPKSTDQDAANLIIDAIDRMNKGEQEIVHEKNGNKIIFSSSKEYGMIAIDVVSAKNK